MDFSGESERVLFSPLLGHPAAKRGNGGVAQVVECLPSKCEALSSNSSTEKTKKLKKKRS
jgi:hypothetical protein